MLRMLFQTFAWLLVGAAVILALMSGKAFAEAIDPPASAAARR